MLNKVKGLLDKAKQIGDPATRSTNGRSDPLAKRILPRTANEAGSPPSAPETTNSNAPDVLKQISDRIESAQNLAKSPEACLDAVTFNEPVSHAEVVKTLRQYGVAIFPEIYSPDRLSLVAEEYDELIDKGAEFASNVAAREDTAAHSYAISILRKSIDENRFPETCALFGSETVERIALDYFSGQKFDFNHDLFVQWTDHTEVPASGALHWDKQLTLKSWLYVTDGTEEHGAMRAGVGTSTWTRYQREDAMFDGLPYGQINNRVDEAGFPIISTGGPAGSFFLFVTDTAHGATPVAPGKRRNIIRARSRPVRIANWANWANKL